MPAFALALVLLASASPVPAASCSGADPAVTGAVVKSRSPNGNLTHFVIAVTVRNAGAAKQASNLLQSVAVYQNGVKVDQKGLQPLGPGQSQTVTYAFDRSSESADGTTHFRFQLDMHGAAVPGPADCNAGNDAYRLDV